MISYEMYTTSYLYIFANIDGGTDPAKIKPTQHNGMFPLYTFLIKLNYRVGLLGQDAPLSGYLLLESV